MGTVMRPAQKAPTTPASGTLVALRTVGSDDAEMHTHAQKKEVVIVGY